MNDREPGGEVTLSTDELQALVEVGRTVNAQLELDDVLDSIMTVITRIMQVEASSLVLIDDESGDLLFHVALGPSAGNVQPLRMQRGEGIVGRVVETGEPLVVNDVTREQSFCGRIDEESGFLTRSILCCPLKTRKRLYGAVELMNKRDGSDFNARDLELCEAVASHAAVAIEVSMLHRRILGAERLAAVGETMTGMAHCVKNVLNCIRTGAYVVDTGLERNDVEHLKKGWAIVKRNNAYMEDLVLDMLAYSKERKPERVPVDLRNLFAEICEAMGQKVSEKGVRLVWHVDEALETVFIDGSGIRRGLLNLVSNALDAVEGREGALVELRAERGTGALFHIVVRDNGCGIPETARDRLFTAFFSTKGARGTGLGLPVTKKIIEEHGGLITVESTPGEGTTFFITLPEGRTQEA